MAPFLAKESTTQAPKDLHSIKTVLISHDINDSRQMHILLEVKIKNNRFQMLPSFRGLINQGGRRGALAKALCRALLHVEIGLRIESDGLSDWNSLEIDFEMFEGRKQWADYRHIYQDNNSGIRRPTMKQASTKISVSAEA